MEPDYIVELFDAITELEGETAVKLKKIIYSGLVEQLDRADEERARKLQELKNEIDNKKQHIDKLDRKESMLTEALSKLTEVITDTW